MESDGAHKSSLKSSEQFALAVFVALLGCILAFVGLLTANNDFAISAILMGLAALCTMESFRITPKGRWLVPIVANAVVAIIVAMLASALASFAFR